jgi:hypothetical protein
VTADNAASVKLVCGKSGQLPPPLAPQMGHCTLDAGHGGHHRMLLIGIITDDLTDEVLARLYTDDGL